MGRDDKILILFIDRIVMVFISVHGNAVEILPDRNAL